MLGVQGINQGLKNGRPVFDRAASGICIASAHVERVFCSRRQRSYTATLGSLKKACSVSLCVSNA
jgi:hypothetical protein